MRWVDIATMREGLLLFFDNLNIIRDADLPNVKPDSVNTRGGFFFSGSEMSRSVGEFLRKKKTTGNTSQFQFAMHYDTITLIMA